jgi:uncharacterized lipoprotein YmbA
MKCLSVLHRAIAAALLLLAGGCGSSPPVRYYTLAADQSPAKAEVSDRPAGAYAVAVGPVTVPAAVDRPQLVVQVAPNRVALLDDQRWAEPLNRGIPRAIASDLAGLLGVPTVMFPQDSLADVKYRVAIEIRSFISVPSEAATVEASWTVFGPHDAVKRGQLLAREPVKDGGYDALAAAHGRALMRISHEVAATIRSEETGRSEARSGQ